MSATEQAPKHWLIIPAAGVGSRMGAQLPKQYLQLDERCILDHTVSLFEAVSHFSGIYLGLSPEDSHWPSLIPDLSARVQIFSGGRERSETVIKGLEGLLGEADQSDWVWVHDAARPLLEQGDIMRVKEALESNPADGLVLAAPLHDTIKQDDTLGNIAATMDRDRLWKALTPQVFRIGDLHEALKACAAKGFRVTDEASAMEFVGRKPLLLEGASTNIKITRPDDLEYARFMKRNSKIRMPRIGTGYDVHAFEPGDEIILGGVPIPFKRSFKAHSDGDVLLHAVMDAMLGALALGDIGKHFPDTDERWRGANSRDLLAAVSELVTQNGFYVGNLDATIVAQAPKMSPHIVGMRQNLAQDLGLDLDQVAVKATTTEKLGFEGRGEGVSVQATVLLYPIDA